VVGIKLDRCNGGERWQQSLVSAIRTASPLPAPPDASVYADQLSLSFESEGFQPDGSTQGFEPEMRVANNDSQALESFKHFANGGATEKTESNGTGSTNVIHLTIIGSPAPAPPPADPASTPVPENPPTSASPQ
jgi:hypothetical protein